MDEHYTRVDGTPQPKKKSIEHQPVRFSRSFISYIYLIQRTLSVLSVKAPGTFGFDYSKYSSRQPRTSPDEFGHPPEEENSDDIEMDEQHQYQHTREESYPEDESPQPPPPPEEEEQPPSTPKPTVQRRETGDRIRRHVQPPPSPAPFSQYMTAGNSHGEGEGGDVAQYAAQMEMDERGKEGRGRQDVEEEKGAGCCKCVVM